MLESAFKPYAELCHLQHVRCTRSSVEYHSLLILTHPLTGASLILFLILSLSHLVSDVFHIK
jgi:hypothetical protein